MKAELAACPKTSKSTICQQLSHLCYRYYDKNHLHRKFELKLSNRSLNLSLKFVADTSTSYQTFSSKQKVLWMAV